MSKNKRHRPIQNIRKGEAETTARKASTSALRGAQKIFKADYQKIVALVDAEEGRGLTGKEIELILNMRSASSRIHEMVRDGWLIRTKLRRRNPGRDGTPETGSWASILTTPDDDTPRIAPLPAPLACPAKCGKARRQVTSASTYPAEGGMEIKTLRRLINKIISVCEEANTYLTLIDKVREP